MPTNATNNAAAPAGLGIPLILTTLVSWASIPLFLKYFTASIDGWTANGWRYGLSALFWLPLLALAHQRGKLPRAIYSAALVPAIFNLVGQTCFAWCPYFLDPGFFTFVFRVQIVFVTLGAWLLFPEERATLRAPLFWVGTVLVVLGSVGLVLFADAPISISTPSIAGEGAASVVQGLAAVPPLVPREHSIWAILLAVTSGVVFAGYGLAVRRNMRSYSAVLAFGVICQYTAVGTIVLMLVLGRNHGLDVVRFTWFQWFMLGASSLIGIAISHVLYYAALTRLGIAVSMGIIQLQPILTGFASMLIFDEQLNARQWTCGIVGVVGALLILVAGQLKRAAEPPPVAAREERDERLAEAVSDAGG